MADQEASALWADTNRRVLGELAELSIAAAQETNDLLANLQRASLDALREQHAAFLRWHSLWPQLITDPLRWYQQALQESVQAAQRAFQMMGTNARVLSQAGDRLHTAAEEMGQRVQEALSSSASHLRDTVRRAA